MDKEKELIEKSQKRILTILRLLYITCAFIFCLIVLKPFLPPEELARPCINDLFHGLFANISNSFYHHLDLVNILITSSSLIYDLTIPITIGIWVFVDKTPKFPLAFGLIHVLRNICLYIHVMKAPDNIIWHDPELIPSLTVSYSVPTQLFYNGQIAIMALSVFYLTSFRDQWQRRIGIFIYCPLLVFQMTLMVLLRASYSIDVLFALITAHYLNWISGRILNYLQNKLNKFIYFSTTKAIFMGIILLLVHVYFIKYYSENEENSCVIDRCHRLTNRLNSILNRDVELARKVIILIAMTIDSFTIIFSFLLLFVIKGFALITVFLMGMVTRGLSLYLTILPEPEGKLWFYTGVFSFLPFDPTPDYFFSGHVMTMTLASIICFNYGGKIKKLACYFLWPMLIIEFWLLIIVRVHYTLDLIYGFIIAHEFMMIVHLFESDLNTFFDRQSLKLAIIYTRNKDKTRIQ